MGKCSFDKNEITITQYGGIVHGLNKKFNALSHYGYRATDITILENNMLYAPCALKCVFHAKVPSFGCVASVFETRETVQCADGNSRDLTFMLFHGGTDNGLSTGNLSSVPELEKSYSKGEYIYKMGLDGLGSGLHIHLDILNGHISKNGQATITEAELKNHITMYSQPFFLDEKGNPIPVSAFKESNSLNFHEVFFNTKGIAFSTNALPGDPTAQDTWGSDVTFTVPKKFNPIGKKDGWHMLDGDRYYVKNQACLTGWQSLTGYEAPTLLEYFYFDSDGVMQTDKFISSGSKWYFVNEKGVMVKNTWITYPLASGDMYYLTEDGSMVSNQWFYYENEWYYLNTKGVMLTGWFEDPNGGWYFLNDNRFTDKPRGVMIRSSWIAASDSRWCYVNSGGAMISNGQANIGGRWYKFDRSGYCTDNNGSAYLYPNIPVITI